jgi:hypothetical protein
MGNLIHHHQNGYPINPQTGSQQTLTPVEFRRKVILQPTDLMQAAEPKDLMERLMQEERRLQAPRLVPAVEVHPIKLCYSVVCQEYLDPPTSPSGAESHDGFVLVSQDDSATETLQSLMKVTAPKKASSCVRIWSQRVTRHRSRFEVLHLEDLEVVDDADQITGATSVDVRKRHLTVDEWLSTHSANASQTQLKVLVETRQTFGSEWPRKALEFENCIKAGDFVDAQDSSGKWFESVVREVTEDTVTVHYLGWASKWDATLKRRRHGKGVEGIMQVGKITGIRHLERATCTSNDCSWLPATPRTVASLDKNFQVARKASGRRLCRSKRLVLSRFAATMVSWGGEKSREAGRSSARHHLWSGAGGTRIRRP